MKVWSKRNDLAAMLIDAKRWVARSAKAGCACPCCGMSVRKLNKHCMDKSKVRVLYDIYRIQMQHNDWVKAEQGDVLCVRRRPVPWSKWIRYQTAKCADAHACRLKWFGLLKKREKRSGEYKITKKGIAFLQGRGLVPAFILVRDGNIWEESPDQVGIAEVAAVIHDKTYWDNYALEQVAPTRMPP